MNILRRLFRIVLKDGRRAPATSHRVIHVFLLVIPYGASNGFVTIARPLR
ncbi:MAG: hypothetical protein JO354_03745 [Verrucomicrobia bacterium]|nr:hypothetical protein [Verrucomicrobiota bacterium]